MEGRNSSGKYGGRRAVLMPRGSTTRQAISVKDQVKHMTAYCERQDITIVAVIGDAGITASKPWARSDFEELLDRKRTLDDFDLLVVYDSYRFSRAGPINAPSEYREILSHGIDILLSSEEMLNGPDSEALLVQRFAESHGQAQQMAKTICRGLQTSLEEGRSLPCKHIPFGLEKVIRMPNGQIRHVIRELRDGTQEVYDGITGKLVQQFQARRKGSGGRYVKQREDMEELRPGNKDDCSIIHYMFDCKQIDGWGGYRISKSLNEQGKLSPRNGKWNPGSVDYILNQPAYVGYVVGNQTSKAIYHQCSQDEPQKVVKDARSRAAKEAPSSRIRSKTDWLIIDQPMMASFLPESIRHSARQRIEHRMTMRAENGGKYKHRRSRHTDSPYSLSGILKEIRCGYLTKGVSSKGYRYYRIRNSDTHPGSEIPKPNQIRAEKIDAVVTDALRMVLNNSASYTDRIRREINRQRRTASLSEIEIEQLALERKTLDQDCRYVHRNRDKYGEEMANQLVEENRIRCREIDDKLTDVKRQDFIWGDDIDKKIAELTTELVDVSSWIEGGPSASVKRLLRVFVSKASVNTKTKELEIEFRVPKSVYDRPGSVRLVTDLEFQVGYETNYQMSLPLTKLRFIYRDGKYAMIERIDPKLQS